MRSIATNGRNDVCTRQKSNSKNVEKEINNTYYHVAVCVVCWRRCAVVMLSHSQRKLLKPHQNNSPCAVSYACIGRYVNMWLNASFQLGAKLMLNIMYWKERDIDLTEYAPV